MLLTITNHSAPSDDLSFLLHKHPARLQRFALSHGEALVYYPEVNASRCTVCLLLVLDPVALVRRSGNTPPLLVGY